MQRIFLLTGCLLALAGATAETVRVASPDGLNEIRVECTDGLRYSVWRGNSLRLAPAPVSLCVRGKRFSPRVVSSEPFTLSGEGNDTYRPAAYFQAGTPFVRSPTISNEMSTFPFHG